MRYGADTPSRRSSRHGGVSVIEPNKTFINHENRQIIVYVRNDCNIVGGGAAPGGSHGYRPRCAHRTTGRKDPFEDDARREGRSNGRGRYRHVRQQRQRRRRRQALRAERRGLAADNGEVQGRFGAQRPRQGAHGRAVERDHRAYQRGLDPLYGAADALRHRRHSRRYVYAPLAPVPAGDQRCGVVQPLYGARHGREDGLRSQGEQHPLDLFADYGSRPQGRMVARVGELRRGCLSVGRNGAPNGAGLSGRRPQPHRRLSYRVVSQALHGLRHDQLGSGPHTGIRVAERTARKALRAVQGRH